MLTIPTTAANATATPNTPPAQPDPNELKPNADSTPDPNELKPNVPADNSAATPPQQVNEITQSSGTANGQASSTGQSTASSDSELADENDIASSKPKKKKGIHKVVPF